MKTEDIREQAHRLVDKLPPRATWEDLMHEIYIRQAIESGIRDSENGRVSSTEEVRKRFGLAT